MDRRSDAARRLCAWPGSNRGSGETGFPQSAGFLVCPPGEHLCYISTGKTLSQRSLPDHGTAVRARHLGAGRSGRGDPHCAVGEPCGRLRNIAISPDGDTALVSTDASDGQILADRDVSALVLLRNVRAFAQSKNKADLRIRVFGAIDLPKLDNVSGVAFGPGGGWAVVSTAGPGLIDLTYKRTRGTLVVITGLPDN